MPYHITRHGDGSYSVMNVENGRVHSKHTTLEKAKAQVRLLQAVDHGFKPTGRNTKKRDYM